MYELSKTTWHYRMYRRLRNFYEDGSIRSSRFTDYRPNSLCSYFWTTVLMTVVLLPVLTLLAFAATVIGLTSPVWYPAMRRKKKLDMQWEDHRWYGGPKPQRNFFGVKTDRAPRQSLVLAWFRAYKNKHCPLITLVD